MIVKDVRCFNRRLKVTLRVIIILAINKKPISFSCEKDGLLLKYNGFISGTIQCGGKYPHCMKNREPLLFRYLEQRPGYQPVPQAVHPFFLTRGIIHAEAVTAAFIDVQLGRDVVLQQALIKHDAVGGLYTFVVGGMKDEGWRSSRGHMQFVGILKNLFT